MTLNCIIIDPNALQRMDTIKKSNDHNHLNVMAEFSSYKDAHDFLAKTTVDLIFLEINTPQMNGFEFLDILNDSLTTVPYVIITTKQKEFAFLSYRYGVVDFLEKPLDSNLFEKAINKVLSQKNFKSNPSVDNSDNQHIFVKSNLKKRKVFIKDIKWIEALGDYVKLITINGSYVILSTMKSFENDLPSSKFLRIHKSYIINLKRIERYNSKFVEIDNYKIPLSRNKKANLTQALELVN